MSERQTIDWQLLLKDAQSGDQLRQNELIKALNVRLGMIIQYRCWGWSTEDQEDILQETLKVFWEKLDSISDHPKTFALKILRNKIGDELRKRLGRRNVLKNDEDNPPTFCMLPLDELMLSDESNDIEGKVEYEEIIDRFKQAIKKLPPFCKTFFMGLLEGKNINDMWEFFSSLDSKLNRSAFDTRNSRCRQKLMAELRKRANVGKGNLR